MNKKIFAGLMSMTAAGAFWACGSGNINEVDNTDDGITRMAISDLDGVIDPQKIQSTLIEPAKAECLKDALSGCKERYADYLAGTPMSSAASADPNTSASTNPNGGNTTPVVPNPGPIIIDPSNPIVVPTDTSNVGGGGGNTPVGTPDADFGTCALSTGGAVADKGVPVNFTFAFGGGASNYGVMAIGTATYEWNFDATKATSDGLGNKTNSPGLTFAVSGDQDVSVTVTVGGDTKTIPCPLHVNGEKISGCVCTAAASTIDLNEGPATWTVSPTCSTTPAGGALSYEWDGVVGESTYNKTFATENRDGYTPKLVVRNEDNSVEYVDCPAVRAVDGPEYVLESSGVEIALPAGEVVITTKFSENWHNGDVTGNCNLQCGAVDGNASLAGTIVNGTPVMGVNGNNFQTGISIASTINSAITLTLPTAAKCTVHW